MSPDRLVYMANQIGRFFVSQGAEEAVTGTANHIRQFWDPRMRRGIVEYLEAGSPGLDPNVAEAIRQIAREDAKA